MFQIGFWELITICIVALIFIGPEHLPSFARKAGYWLGTVRRLANNARRELEQELNLENNKNFGQKLSDLDDLMKYAPDQDPESSNKNSTTDNNK